MTHRFFGAVVVVALVAVPALGAPPTFPGTTTIRVPGRTTDAAIPDNDAMIEVLSVDVPGVIVDVDVELDVRHTTPDHLDMYLVSPRGTVVPLATDLGGGADHVFSGVVFDDQAPPQEGGSSAACVRNVSYRDNVALGTVQPEGALSALFGEPAAGPWALVVADDTNGTIGTLRSWALVLTTRPALPLAAPPIVVQAAVDTAIPENAAAGLAATLETSGLGKRLLGLRVFLDIAHPRADHLDLFLVAPSGARIDLATDIGGGAVDLFSGTAFDDREAEPVSDATLPASGEALAAVVPEGALGAFLGEDPNGIWTLEVVDDTRGQQGTLRSWGLELVATATCGDGVLDPGETCDDGNGLSGDGCEADCRPTPEAPANAAERCGSCADEDEDGLVDALDPDCAAGRLDWQAALVRTAGDGTTRLRLLSRPLPAPLPEGPTALLLADAGTVLACAALGDIERRGRGAASVRGQLAGGTVTLRAQGRSGRVVLKGRGLRLGTAGDPALTVGLRIGDRTWLAAVSPSARGLPGARR